MLHTRGYDMEIKDRIEKLMSYLNEGLVERKEAVALSLLSALAGESIFFYGPPGTAKSMISRRINTIFSEEGNYFEYLMNQFSTPEDLFGPISLKGLEEDVYKRLTKGYLPCATVAFLDEIWKAGPAIQNTLLSIINEKRYNNGNEVEKVPLIFLIAASNELPKEGKGLEALWDRFLVRVLVSPIEDEEGFFSLITQTEGETHLDTNSIKDYKLDATELKELKRQSETITLSKTIKDTISDIRHQLIVQSAKDIETTDSYVSDRRWKKIIHLLRMSALLNQRDHVAPMDCFLIQYCIWSTQEQQQNAFALVATCIQHSLIEKTDFKTIIQDYETQVSETFFGDLRFDPLLKRIGNDDCYILLNQKTEPKIMRKVTYISQSTAYDKKGNRISYATYGIRNYLDVHSLTYDATQKKIHVTFIEGEKILPPLEFSIETKEAYHKDVRKKVLYEDAKKLHKVRANFDTRYYFPLREKLNLANQKYTNTPLEESIFASQKEYNFMHQSFQTNKNEIEMMSLHVEQIRARYVD